MREARKAFCDFRVLLPARQIERLDPLPQLKIAPVGFSNLFAFRTRFSDLVVCVFAVPSTVTDGEPTRMEKQFHHIIGPQRRERHRTPELHRDAHGRS